MDITFPHHDSHPRVDPLLSRTHPLDLLYCADCGDRKDDNPNNLCLPCINTFNITNTSIPSTTNIIRFTPPLPCNCLACSAIIHDDGNAQGLCDECVENFG